ncbi:MAG TPA: thymidylate kinase [Pseudonocardiaceae bacterium]|nr:thymidylate kinase [Pseudonocardiaceae bacterium]
MNGPVTVAVVGADGVGKSTVTVLLADRLCAEGVPATLIDRWDVVDSTNYPTGACLTKSVRTVRYCATRMSTTPRLLFLLWASTLALTDRVGDQLDGFVLLDGFWMKNAASEIAYGADAGWVQAIAAGLPAADLVVYLRLDPEVAWQRMDGQPLPYECGMDVTCSRASFLSHQNAIRTVLDDWADQDGWLVVNADQPLDDVVDQLAEACDLLAGRVRS